MCAVVWACCINSFLCVTSPVATDILVVESWSPDYAMQGAVDEFRKGGYKLVITPGSMPPPTWFQPRYPTIAAFAAANLEVMGIQSNHIVSVPGERIIKNRTFASAMAVRDWLSANQPSARAINVYSVGPHARRTRLLYEKAFDGKIKVGILSHRDLSYTSSCWWASMGAVRSIFGETIAYAYVRFFFWHA
jgi:hypothetical protein